MVIPFRWAVNLGSPRSHGGHRDRGGRMPIAKRRDFGAPLARCPSCGMPSADSLPAGKDRRASVTTPPTSDSAAVGTSRAWRHHGGYIAGDDRRSTRPALALHPGNRSAEDISGTSTGDLLLCNGCGLDGTGTEGDPPARVRQRSSGGKRAKLVRQYLRSSIRLSWERSMSTWRCRRPIPWRGFRTRIRSGPSVLGIAIGLRALRARRRGRRTAGGAPSARVVRRSEIGRAHV